LPSAFTFGFRFAVRPPLLIALSGIMGLLSMITGGAIAGSGEKLWSRLLWS
jgi:hypothetical protein